MSSSFNRFSYIEPSRRQDPRVDASPIDNSELRRYKARRQRMVELCYQQEGAVLAGDHRRIAELAPRIAALQAMIDAWEAAQDVLQERAERNCSGTNSATAKIVYVPPNSSTCGPWTCTTMSPSSSTLVPTCMGPTPESWSNHLLGQ